MTQARSPKHCIVIPFKGREESVARCLKVLRQNCQESSIFLLVDDSGPGSATEASSALDEFRGSEQVVFLRHASNLGVAAARNTALRWCREQAVEIVLMIDSDCEPGPDFIREHLRLHAENPAVAGFGGGIVGVGETFWSRVDCVMSWVHSMPFGENHVVSEPYHLPTTNLSLKMSRIPNRPDVFESRLATGEDALFVRELRNSGQVLMFSAKPAIKHYDRTNFFDVLKHHYVWGHHQYFVQLGNMLSPRCFRLRYRVPFLLFFFCASPAYAGLGTFLNLKPWMARKPKAVFYAPWVYFIWLSKSMAVLEAAAFPNRVLRSGGHEA